MHWTTHVLTGGATGCLLGRPVASVFAGAVTHLALDITPHYDPERDWAYVADSLLGILVLLGIALSNRALPSKRSKAAFWGAVGAGLPDVELLAKQYLGVAEEDLLFPTHNGLTAHREAPLAPSLLSQGALALASAAVLLRGCARRVEPVRAGSG